MRCPKCGRFVKNCVATVNGFGEITHVQASCSRCGTVHPTDWCYEDFFDEGNSHAWLESQREQDGAN